jgi:cell division cycle protein 37
MADYRWKQRDIHEKRELRRLKITHLGLEDVMNASLLLRLQSLIKSTQDEDAPFIARTISQLRATVPNFDNPKPLADGEQPSEDHMILNLLVQVVNGVQKKGEDDSSASLVKELQEHETRLIERQAQIVVEKAAEEKEQKRYITSDDLHMGFESKTVSHTMSAPLQDETKASFPLLR